MNMNFPQYMLEAAHKHSINNKNEISDSYLCVCFRCCTMFAVEKINKWADEETGLPTALCPECGADSVLANRSGYPIHEGGFIRAMKKHWFGQDKIKRTKKK